MTNHDFGEISDLLGFPIAEKVFHFLPEKPYSGPILVLPGHKEKAIVQLYFDAIISGIGGLVVYEGKENYSLLSLSPAYIHGSSNPVSGQLHVGNLQSDPWRKFAIPTRRFIEYMTMHQEA